ncbi:MAG: acetoin utilization protein AcuC [Chloroflexota bacterium]|nr:acetoin utilization protein AcuC [Chloroflexota bacterium]
MSHHEVALLWGGPIEYDFGPQHPLQPVRVELAVELMRAYGLLDRANVRLVAPRLASDEELRLIHAPDYIEAVRQASANHGALTSIPEYCLGPGDNPIFAGMHEASAQVAGGTLQAAEFVLEGKQRHAFAIAGGLHHAMARCASGFCIYNDAAIAIEFLRRRGLRVVYLDTDVHHGDGVQAAFYATDRVLTISFHEDGRFLFPGTGSVHETGAGAGQGYSVNVPLPPGTGDEAYLFAFDALFPALVRAFRPDVIVNQNGADAHRKDPLAHLRASINLYRHIAGAVHRLSHELCAGRWLAMGGGGYDLYDAVPRAWTLLFSEMAGEASLPPALPQSWIEFGKAKGVEEPPRLLLEERTSSTRSEMEAVADIVEQVRRAIPMLHE